MTIQLLYNASEMNKLDKELTPVLELTGSLRDSTSVTNPVLLIEYSGVLPAFNYMYIPEFNRYYFVGEIEVERTGLWTVSARCDVLTTYKDSIRRNTAVIRRQENQFNLYLDDGMFKSYQNPHFSIIPFPQGFTTQELVLAVAGGQGNE